MPERLDCVLLLEVVNDEDIRSDLLQKIETIISIQPDGRSRLMLLEIKSGEVVTWKFPEAQSKLNHSLSYQEILFIYYDNDINNPIISIKRHDGLYSYKVSFRTLEMLSDNKRLCIFLESLYLTGRAMGMHCVVAAGPEYVANSASRSVDDVLRLDAASDDLIEYLCCEKNEPARPGNFIGVYEGEVALILKRSRPII